MDKWFYIYGIPVRIHSNPGRCFDNQIMKHLYAMYGIEQSTTKPYNLHGNAQCEQFNCTMVGLLSSLLKEQKDNWPLHLPSLVFAYNAMPRSTTGYQPNELMFGCKAPTIYDVWLRLAVIMIIIHRASVNELTNSMSSSLLWIGMPVKESNRVQKNQYPRQEARLSRYQ